MSVVILSFIKVIIFLQELRQMFLVSTSRHDESKPNCLARVSGS